MQEGTNSEGTHTHTRARARARAHAHTYTRTRGRVDEAYARYARAISMRERNKRAEPKVVKRSPEKREEHGDPVINHR